jgi:glycosyltransferase involved in cell wall biosynthesis
MSTELTQPLVSIIIPARNEFPQIVFTIYSIIADLESFLKPQEFEIIIMANCISDWYNVEKDRRGTQGTVDYLMGRSIFFNRIVKVCYDPIAGNHSTRNKGAKLARGKYLFFSDAHMAYSPGFFKKMIRAIDETDGVVHGAIGWLGGYPPKDQDFGYQYTMKLGEEIKGTWANYKLCDDYFYIPFQGHCCLGVKREQFLKFGGYPEYHRCYGGGEFYFDIKWWMLGSRVSVEPNALAYHLCSSRGYSYNYDDYIHNVLAIGLALGMDDWAERAYINWCRRGNLERMKQIWEQAKKKTVKDREFIEKNRVMTFNQLLVDRTWDKLNDERYGKHNSSMLIFHETWIENFIKGTPAEKLYNESEIQKGLEKFINENLSEFVYKRGHGGETQGQIDVEATRISDET